MDTAKTPSSEAKTGKTPSRDMLYSEVAKYAPRAIEVLVDIMENGDNSNAKTGAAKAILAKAIPDLKAMEVYGKDGEKFEALVVIKHGNTSNEVADQSLG